MELMESAKQRVFSIYSGRNGKDMVPGCLLKWWVKRTTTQEDVFLTFVKTTKAPQGVYIHRAAFNLPKNPLHDSSPQDNAGFPIK